MPPLEAWYEKGCESFWSRRHDEVIVKSASPGEQCTQHHICSKQSPAKGVRVRSLLMERQRHQHFASHHVSLLCLWGTMWPGWEVAVAVAFCCSLMLDTAQFCWCPSRVSVSYCRVPLVRRGARPEGGLGGWEWGAGRLREGEGRGAA